MLGSESYCAIMENDEDARVGEVKTLKLSIAAAQPNWRGLGIVAGNRVRTYGGMSKLWYTFKSELETL